MALTCAAVDDVTAWCLLALLVSIVQSRFGGALLTAGMTVCFIATMIFLVRPLIVRLVRRQEPRGLTRGAMAAICVGMLLSALVSEGIGIHAVFGAFLLGALVPHDSSVARQLWEKLEDLVLVASLGKFGGTLLAARLTGSGWREALSLGVLMNTRGLMELVVLNIGLDLKVISPTLFAMLVIMAVVTTLATSPFLHLLTARDRPSTNEDLGGQ